MSELIINRVESARVALLSARDALTAKKVGDMARAAEVFAIRQKNEEAAKENLNAYLNDVRMRQQAGLANAVPMLGSMQPPKPKPEPKPCPFCGGSPVITLNSRAFGKSYWTVGCLVCHVVIARTQRKKALAVWNHRVP